MCAVADDDMIKDINAKQFPYFRQSFRQLNVIFGSQSITGRVVVYEDYGGSAGRDSFLKYFPGMHDTAVKAAYEAVTAVEDVISPDFELRNYPNPFNSNTTISFNLGKASHVNLSVYDISGRRVELLINENRLAGLHEVQFAPSSGSSNIYFIRLTTEDNTVTRKMMMLK